MVGKALRLRCIVYAPEYIVLCIVYCMFLSFTEASRNVLNVSGMVDPAPVDLTVVLKLSRYFSVLHLHHVVLSCGVNTTENPTSMDSGSKTLQLV